MLEDLQKEATPEAKAEGAPEVSASREQQAEAAPEGESETSTPQAAEKAKKRGRKRAEATPEVAQGEAAPEAVPEPDQEAAENQEVVVQGSQEAQVATSLSLSEAQYAVGWYGRALNTAPLRVWVLAGGESGDRDLGLEGAVDMFLRLRSQQDLLVRYPWALNPYSLHTKP